MKDPIYFIYDGECPICNLGANYTILRENIGTMETLDARVQQDHPIVMKAISAGIDLDQGMVVQYRDKLYHGRKAAQLLASLSRRRGFINFISIVCFQHPIVSRLTYPIAKLIRRIALRVKGVGKIDIQPNTQKH